MALQPTEITGLTSLCFAFLTYMGFNKNKKWKWLPATLFVVCLALFFYLLSNRSNGSAALPNSKNNSENSVIKIAGDNSGNVANVNNSPGAKIMQSIGSPSRKISPPEVEEIKKLLRKTPPLEMDITIDWDSGGDTREIADQIRKIFMECGYQNAGYGTAKFAGEPIRGVVVAIPGMMVDKENFRPSDPHLVEALTRIYSAIGEQPKFQLAPKNAVYFRIGQHE